MTTLEEIKNRLKTLGVADNDADKIIEDVMSLIAAATLKSYVSSLNPAQKIKLQSVSESEIAHYLEGHADEFPAMSKEEFDRIYQETWDNYFNIMTKE